MIRALWHSDFISTEIPNFLDDHEIENILLQANEYGLFSSRAKGGLTPKDLFKPSEGTINSIYVTPLHSTNAFTL